ncbi:glucose-1-phosphate cytidylyltransferase [Clostridium sp. OS1-26]|uniref:glucose-1-phosphate cytidylyltransferase n=1 Tax=Clostridium sp. OS1-26 TaxID=3070681 RepID=UPI0027DFADAD|nr:glucose-1-phosphate cytidylyltransferase [Clostridium sp. OS1-26]WML36761.1 glucose-1-phosphate cytidylyltransferase [Clostridium sp. OS1-26]
MKVVILAGGFGTRINEESHLRPKPMIEIDNMPILWHIMKSYSYYGFNDFIICCGYKAYVIKEYFAQYYLHRSDITYDFANNNQTEIHSNVAEPWKVTLVDTGLNTMTGGRIKRIKDYIGDEPFMLTYGDGVCDINIKELVEYHKQHGSLATITAIQPGGRFGALEIDEKNNIRAFAEKRKEDGGWINGGFMVLQPEVIDLIKDDTTVFEKEPLETLAKTNQLKAYYHNGFWQCMDTLRDKMYLEELIANDKAPWKVWEK